VRQGHTELIPYGRQEITAADIAAVTQVLGSDFLTQGPAVPRFEQAIADYCGVAHGVAVNSATSALHLACLALDLGPGDWLWTSPNTFVASANCGRYCGAAVDFVDINRDTYNLCPEALAAKLEEAEGTGHLPKVVIPVHFAGQPCDMAAIGRLAQRYGFRIIEDASHAIGGRYRGEPIGNCRYSDITVFSFHPVKIITTGEGGLATTNNPVLAERMARLRSHGITRDSEWMQGDTEGPWYYQQIELGFNYRLTDIQAALGRCQLQRVDDYVARRQRLAARYDREFANLPLRTPYRDPEHQSALHLYPIQVLSGRRRVFESLRLAGIGVNVHYIPVHTQPDYRQFGFRPGDFPHAEAYYAHALSLPLFPTMTEAEQDQVMAVLASALT
jgi:UDP-4-amino-4,6-dideoxy-N-acetyl-beta-L-altrosamine transaminase